MQNNRFRVLALGDVVGSAAVGRLEQELRGIRAAENLDFVVVNAENCADGNGMDAHGAQALLDCGADVLTGGNHTIRLRDAYPLLEENEAVLRPCNLPPLCPGKGYTILPAASGLRILVINAIGQTYMPPADNAFCAVDRILHEQAGKYDLALCDLHAEATSEKLAFFAYFDGRIQAMWGTHTHVPTADERLLAGGSAAVTDLGMCGVTDSVLGVKTETVVRQFVTGVHERFERAKGVPTLQGVIFEIDVPACRVCSVRRIQLA